MADQRFSFVLRLWFESGATLRGSLQMVDADQVRYFSSLDQMVAILQTAIQTEINDPILGSFEGRGNI